MCTSAHGCVHMCKTGICIHVDINAGVYTPENTGTCAQQAHMYMGMHMWYRDVRTYRCAHIHRNTCSYTCLLGTHAQDIHKHTYTQEQMYMVTLFGHVNPQEHLCTCTHTGLCPVTGGSILGGRESVLMSYAFILICHQAAGPVTRCFLRGPCLAAGHPCAHSCSLTLLLMVGWKGQAQEAFRSALKTVLNPCPPLACSSIKHL